MSVETEEAANRILDALQSKRRSFVLLKDLAAESKFSGAHNRLFRQGLAYLLRHKIIKLHQSGWRSEKRGHKKHPKGVILIANLFEYTPENIPEYDPSGSGGYASPLESQNTAPIPKKKQLSRFLELVHKCDDCKKQPEVYVTDAKVPVCSKHWDQLNRRDYQW